MGVPKKHKTPGSRNQRRSHIRLTKSQFAVCKNCGQAVLPHAVCEACGYYRGEKVTDVGPKAKK